MIWPFSAPVSAVIAPLRSEYVQEAAALHAAAFAAGWSVQELERLVREGSSETHGAWDGRTGTLLGFIISRIALDEAEILTIAVREQDRRRGIGRDMLEVHLSALVARGVRRLFLEVDEQNAAALALYLRRGFTTVGRRPAYYRKPDGSVANALVMRLDID